MSAGAMAFLLLAVLAPRREPGPGGRGGTRLLSSFYSAKYVEESTGAEQEFRLSPVTTFSTGQLLLVLPVQTQLAAEQCLSIHVAGGWGTPSPAQLQGVLPCQDRPALFLHGTVR